MASQKIDELQLQIGSDASDAIRQLGNLATALNIAAASASKLGGASGDLQRFASGIDRLGGSNFGKAIDNLTKLSRINLNNLKSKTVHLDVVVSGTGEAERLKYAHEDAAKSIAKNSMTIAKALGQKYNVDTEGVRSLSRLVKDLASDLASGGNGASIQDSMFKVIAEHGRESEAELMGLKSEYKDFLDYFNNTHFSATGLSDIVGRGEALSSSGLLRNLRKDAESADAALAEMASRFPSVFAGLENPADMLEAAVRQAEEARMMLEPHEIMDDGTFDRIGSSIQHTVEDVSNSFDNLTDKFMRESANKIPIDLDVDVRKFEQQIQAAVTEATKIPYKAKPIQIEVDTEKLKSDISSVIKDIDVSKLPEFAQNFKAVSDSISSMNQSSIKDTGITQFTNAFRRLIETDTSKFDVGVFNTIAAGITNIANVGDISNSLNKFVSAIARLANAGDKTKTSADGLRVLVPRLKEAIKALTSTGDVNTTVSQFVASLASLASAGDKTGKTASNLKDLTTAVVEFLNALQNAPEINDNLAMTIQGLGNLAAAGQKTGKALSSIGSGGTGGSRGGSFGTIIGTASNTAVAGLKKVLSISLKLGGQGASALGSFMSRLGLIPVHTAHVNGMALSFGNLLRTVLPFIGLRGVFGWLKESVNLGSSIVEIQNVIDTAFGSLRKGYEDISGYVYKWSKSTIDAFGVSEIAALRYAGRLQSIFNSSGFDLTEGMRDSAAQMTTDLIERAGDIASFYDITVDEAMTKITSGLAGMSRPLRSLGVNMSVANMQAFALSQGINTSWKEMDQASQMALRYQYILHATQYAEGDFQRTSMSLANQLRLLSLNFQVLSSTIGQGLVSAIAPVIGWLNILIRKLIQVATAFRTFMWTLFGKPLAAARGYADDLTGYLDDSADAIGDLGSGAGGASDGLGSAGKAAKELKKQLTVLPFDELNQLAKDTNSAGSGGSGGGGGGGGGLGGLDTSGLLPDFTADLDNSPVLDAINEWARRIRMAFVQRDWGKLGLTIADGINKGFKKLYDLLDWDKWKDKVYNFIQPFQATMNSLVAGVDFDLIGRTLARGLNFITRTFRMWINGFNWRDWGKKLAEGMNGLLDEWDADAFGRAIADKFRAAWNFFGGWVADFDFSLFGTRLKEMIVGALDELNFSDMGESVGRFITGIAESISSALKDGDIRKKATEAFTDFVNGFLKGFNGEDVREALKLLADTIGGILGDTIKGINKDELAADFKSVLEGLPWDTIFKGLGAIVGGKLAVSLIGTAFKNRAKALLEATLPGLVGSSGTAGAAGAAAGATTTGAITLGTITAATLGVTAITLGGIALGKWLDKKLRTLFPSYGKAADSQKTAKESGATGSSTSYSDVWKDFGKYTPGGGTNASSGSAPTASVPKDTKTTNTVTTVMKAISDSSFKEAQKGVEFLGKNPSFTKTMYGKDGGDFKQFVFWMMDTKQYRQNKLMSASDNGNLVKYRGYMVDQGHYKAYKWVYSQDKGKFVLYRNYQTDQGHYSANKWFYGTDKGHFKDYTNILFSLPSTKTVDVKFNITTSAKKIVADVVDAAGQVAKKTVASFRMENAKGGLFTGPVGFQVFGEAGAEAAIPLERKSTMKRIANAIVDSGGFNTGTNSDLANDIAVRVAPIIMDAMNSQSERPINVNATLYTENNEVLAKAVNRGNRSLDKRYHPVAQYSY